jgi:protocatechuate 3,4-dioxygenase beta subunit
VGAFAATSLLPLNRALAQAPLAATPECHDGVAATLRETEGPFFKPSSPERADLYEVSMAGRPLELSGFVLTRGCRPVRGAILDFWQADDQGLYDNSGFRLRGHQFTDAEGRFHLRSIVPGAYDNRTSHVHVKVQPPEGRLLTTQVYFPGEPKNRSDMFFRTDLLLKTADNGDALGARFDFILDIR